jgi:hypothetical protein
LVSENDDSNSSRVPLGVVVCAEVGFSGVVPPLTQSKVAMTEACAATGRAVAKAAVANRRLEHFINLALNPHIELLPCPAVCPATAPHFNGALT